MDLPKLTDLDVSEKKVLLRADLDFNPSDAGNLRFTSLIPTLDYLKKQKSKITIIAHRGRPNGKVDQSLSLMPFQSLFSKWHVQIEENLRFSPGEEANDNSFARSLAQKGEVFINEAFGASHRMHSSIASIPKLLPHAAGLHFIKEVEALSKVLENPAKPLVSVISGVKDDKLKYIEAFKNFSDKILIGGRLPEYIHDASPLREDDKLLIASLIADKEDISIHSVESFENALCKAKTIILSGPLGKFEEEGHRQGTKRVFEAAANANAYKLAGGGDTISALNLLNLQDKFDWLSVGGGAMLDFLAHGTLPGIQALLN